MKRSARNPDAVALPLVPFLIMTNDVTGRHVAVNTTHVTHVDEGDAGTTFSFTDGSSVTVRERFLDVAGAITEWRFNVGMKRRK
ncbi:MAG TPA: hypothetical protein VEP28_01085 [Rubrobacter sp.]|nr:hypothetical protein [Rubrobacter sp.]